VLDVGQRAHGELQAVGQIGAVAVAQRYAPTHDVVAEPFQGVSIHIDIMADKSGNVESPWPIISISRTKQRKLIRRDSGQSPSPSPLVAGLFVCQHPMATSDKPVRTSTGGN
jgi:hypothetical protein